MQCNINNKKKHKEVKEIQNLKSQLPNKQSYQKAKLTHLKKHQSKSNNKKIKKYI